MSWLTPDQIAALGLREVGDDVLIDDAARLYGTAHISIGDRSRIDAFALVTAGPGAVRIGAHVHVAAAAMLFGTAGIDVEDHANLSGRVSVYSTSDDFTGGALTNPTHAPEECDVTHAPVRIGRHAIVGAGSVVLPGVTLARGASVGALSLVKRDVGEGEIVAGNPLRTVGRRPLDRLR